MATDVKPSVQQLWDQVIELRRILETERDTHRMFKRSYAERGNQKLAAYHDGVETLAKGLLDRVQHIIGCYARAVTKETNS